MRFYFADIALYLIPIWAVWLQQVAVTDLTNGLIFFIDIHLITSIHAFKKKIFLLHRLTFANRFKVFSPDVSDTVPFRRESFSLFSARYLSVIVVIRFLLLSLCRVRCFTGSIPLLFAFIRNLFVLWFFSPLELTGKSAAVLKEVENWSPLPLFTAYWRSSLPFDR